MKKKLLRRTVARNPNILQLKHLVLSLANIFFHFVHLTIVFFFLFGWLSEKTLVAHFILSMLILFSWTGLGLFFGFGYCLVTDIQWRIKKQMGENPYTKYYIKYMVDKVTGLDTNPKTVNAMTTCSFFLILTLSSILVLSSKTNIDILPFIDAGG